MAISTPKPENPRPPNTETMTAVIGIDDTDSRTQGMCTTYVGAVVADELEAEGHVVERRLLIRLNPAIEHKTRGNAAVAIHTDASPATAMAVAQTHVATLAVTDEASTQPGIAVVDADRTNELASHTWRTIRDVVSLSTARDHLEAVDADTWTSGGGRGLIGAAAAIGAADALAEWTIERICYRPESRWGTPRSVDRESAFSASAVTYPRTWDTVDVTADAMVCTPNTAGPVLFGLRGDDLAAVRTAAHRVDHEPIERTSDFWTNQGTDVHLVSSSIASVRDGRCYRVSGRVSEAPETRSGGHVHLTIAGDGGRLPCVAFEPTGRFRDRVRGLRVGDWITVCGEVGRGTLKLEKFALRRPRRYRRVVPDCPGCDSRMESAGRGQGYRCRACDTTKPTRRVTPEQRTLSVGWYEVPPIARRHVARPLVRGGMDAPVHPER